MRSSAEVVLEMKNNQKLKQALDRSRQVLRVEAGAVSRLAEAINGEFLKALKLIDKVNGRVLLTGVGKSGLIARKIAATLSSTGTPSYFVHAGEALHGDLGMVTGDDIILAVSTSGETREIMRLIPAVKRIGAGLIVITSNPESSLAEQADLVLDTLVEEEACPLGLAPTTSTTAALALGDALAMALTSLKGLTAEDFALFHPGGSLGRKLLTTVEDVLKIRKQNPRVKESDTIQQALFVMTESRMGSTSVIDQEGRLTGIITDGDIRRAVSKQEESLSRKIVSEVMTDNPSRVKPDLLAAEALKIMEEREINHLPVVTESSRPLGMVNFQDLLRARIW